MTSKGQSSLHSDHFPVATSSGLVASVRYIREQEAKFFLAAIVESSQDSIFTVDFYGVITSWNRASEALFGYAAHEAIGQSMSLLTLPADLAQVLSNIEAIKSSHQILVFDAIRIHKDNHELSLEVVMSPVKDAQGHVIGVSTVARDVTLRNQLAAERQRREQVEAEARAKAEFLRHTVLAQEEERARISRELHDNLGQHLTAVMLGLHALETAVQSITGGQRRHEVPQIAGLRHQIDTLMKAAHRQAWELRPAELDAMGLEAAMGQYISDWSGRSSVPVDFQTVGWDAQRLDTAIETTLYRVGQEALTNVARHAQATRVDVVLQLREQMASVIVEDNGQGFDVRHKTERLGVLGMQERLSIVGGTLDIESSPHEGTTVFAHVPLQAPPAEKESGA